MVSRAQSRTADGVSVNDIHSQFNATTVRQVIEPRGLDEVVTLLQEAEKWDFCVSLCGARHCMGGQPFGRDTVLLDMRKMNRVLSFDADRGIVEAEAGIDWTQLIQDLVTRQADQDPSWGIRQKQTGADLLTLGGALSANIHSRGLTFPPFVSDIESFTLVTPEAQVIECSRSHHPSLFSLAIGGYGLFGVVTSMRLRLMRRQPLVREVSLEQVENLHEHFESKIRAGCLFGDFQFSVDPFSDDFLRKGVCAVYRPSDGERPARAPAYRLTEAKWLELATLVHVDPRRAFEIYADFYRTTHGQEYWSDTHQLSVYVDQYHQEIDRRLQSGPGCEMITEVFVPRSRLADLMKRLRVDLRLPPAQVIYGTIRWVEPERESFLRWARKPWACVVLNLHLSRSPQGKAEALMLFRRIVDRALELEGTFYLAYHAFASREQVTWAYPEFSSFLQWKLRHDPRDRIQSNWYRRYREMLIP